MLLGGYQAKIIMLMRHIDNSWKISDFDTIFYLTHPNHVGKTQWVPCALPVGNVASHVFSWCSGKVQLLKSAGSFPGRRVAVAAVLTGLWGRSVGHISGHGDTWCAGGWSWGRAGWREEHGECPWAAAPCFGSGVQSMGCVGGCSNLSLWHDGCTPPLLSCSGGFLSHLLCTELFCVCCGIAAVWCPLLFGARQCWQQGTELQHSVTVTLYYSYPLLDVSCRGFRLIWNCLLEAFRQAPSPWFLFSYVSTFCHFFICICGWFSVSSRWCLFLDPKIKTWLRVKGFYFSI